MSYFINQYIAQDFRTSLSEDEKRRSCETQRIGWGTGERQEGMSTALGSKHTLLPLAI